MIYKEDLSTTFFCDNHHNNTIVSKNIFIKAIYRAGCTENSKKDKY